MAMNCCNKPNVKDLSQGLSECRHWYCISCGSHNYAGIQYSRKDWEGYVNGSEICVSETQLTLLF